MKFWIRLRYRQHILTVSLISVLLGCCNQTKGQDKIDMFAGVDFNYKDLTARRMYDFLINITPGVKWDMGKGWRTAAQVLIPVYNDFGERYKKIRLNMAVLSKEMDFGSHCF